MSRKTVESAEFYNLMQCYRHIPIERHKEVLKAYEAVKAHIERLLADEREKVREMCAVVADDKELEIDRVPGVRVAGFRRARAIARAIRQLDLSAPSSTEGISIKSFKDMAALDEGGEEK